jgi:hypothetical protein
MHTLTKAVGIAAFFSLSASPVVAICPHPVPKVCSAFFQSAVVFVGRVTSQQYADNGEYIRFDVRVSRVLRGSIGVTTAIYTANDSGRLLWEVGLEYVVFARRDHERLVSGDDCGPLSDPTKVSDTLRQIDGLRRVTSATIEGEVLGSQPDGLGLAGVLVRAQGKKQIYEGKTDSRGLFRIPVPAGTYQVLADPRLKQSDYNWAGLGDIHLVPGQCAQLQLVPR